MGATLLAALLALLAASDLWQVVAAFAGIGHELPLLVGWHAVDGVLESAVAVGLWRRAPWTAAVALAWGVSATALVLSLAPLLELPSEARFGLWVGAVVIALIALGTAAYARRVGRRPS